MQAFSLFLSDDQSVHCSSPPSPASAAETKELPTPVSVCSVSGWSWVWVSPHIGVKSAGGRDHVR